MPTTDRKLHDGDRRAVVNAQPREPGQTRQPPHVFQPALARKVEMLAALKVNQETIAFMCDIGVDCLRKYYLVELEKGLSNANTRVGAAILQSAIGERSDCGNCEGTGEKDDAVCVKCGGTGEGKGWVREPNTTAQIWWSKNQMGWTDQQRIEHVGDGGGPIITEMRSSADTIKARLASIEKRLKPPANDENKVS